MKQYVKGQFTTDGISCRTAKKGYECFGAHYKNGGYGDVLRNASANCLLTITPGQIYFEAQDQPYQSGHRYCLECAKTHLEVELQTI